MKKRLISLLLAFSMMLTFLPAGAVSAFAEAGETIGEATIVPTPGHLIATQGGDWIAFITQPGTYYLSGDYARKIGVRTTDDNADVTIKIVGNITYSGPENVLIQVENVHDLKVETDGPYTINVPGSGSNGIALLIWSQNGSTLVKGGIYKNCMFKLHHRRTELEDVTVETNNSAIWNYGSDVILTRGSYTSNGGPVIENSETTYNTSVYGNLTVNGAKITNTAGSAIVNYDSSKVTINSGTVIESTANCINNQGNGTTLEVNGGNFTSLEDYPAVYNNGKAYIHGGTFTSMGSVIANNGAELIVDEESAETVICNTNTEERGGVRCDGTGKTEINGGTIKDAAYGIWVRNGSPNVTLKNADQLGKTYNVYLSKNQKITIDDAYTKEVTVKCADPYDQRPITNATTGTNQKKLNIKLMDEGYLVGYNKTADGKEYRCLSKKVGVTVSDPEGEVKAGDPAKFTVTLVHTGSTGTGILTFGDKNGEIEYKDENNEYKPMPEGGLKINLGNGEVEHEFRIAPKETGKQTLTAAVKQGENKLATDEKDFVVSEMPILTLKDGVITSVTVPGKNGADPEDITEIVKKNANEDGSFHVPEGVTVSVAFDKDAFADSGLKFGHWDITGLADPNAYQDKESFAFEMPAKAVTLKAMTQDASIEDDEPDIVGPIVIGTTVVVGGAVLGYQAYSLGAEFAGKLMALPYFPSNRSALAMMLWEDAGKPMPESELLYPDVGQEERDMDLQHAARWAMENELIPDLNDEGTAPEEMKFYPDNAVSKIDVLNAWQKAQELKQNA